MVVNHLIIIHIVNKVISLNALQFTFLHLIIIKLLRDKDIVNLKLIKGWWLIVLHFLDSRWIEDYGNLSDFIIEFLNGINKTIHANSKMFVVSHLLCLLNEFQIASHLRSEKNYIKNLVSVIRGQVTFSNGSRTRVLSLR